MSAYFPTSSYEPASRLSARQKLLVWSLIAAAHGLLLAPFLQRPQTAASLGPAQTVMVRLISEAAPETPPPPLPQPTPPPRPEPKVLSSTRPSESPMTAPPPEDEPAEPAPTAPPTVAATPAPTAAAAESAAPSLVPPDFRAAYLNNPGPQYPYASKRLREEGEVLLKVLVSESGQAEQVRVEQSSGYPRLDEAAVDVVRKRWRFVPAQQDGEAVSAWVLVPMIFELKKR
jgi:protein TonB